MNRTFRQLLTSTTLGTAVAVLSIPLAAAAQAQSSCMQDVQVLRERASLGQGGDTAIEASASAAAEACAAGDDGLASAYVADAERRLDLREAQRDESGATADGIDTGSVETGGVAAEGSAGAGFSAAALSRSADDDDGLAEDAGDEIADTAEDVGNEIGDTAEDVGNEIGDAGDAIGDAFD